MSRAIWRTLLAISRLFVPRSSAVSLVFTIVFITSWRARSTRSQLLWNGSSTMLITSRYIKWIVTHRVAEESCSEQGDSSSLWSSDFQGHCCQCWIWSNSLVPLWFGSSGRRYQPVLQDHFLVWNVVRFSWIVLLWWMVMVWPKLVEVWNEVCTTMGRMCLFLQQGLLDGWSLWYAHW